MRAHVAPGWYVKHLTDRTIQLEKPDVMYRRFTGRDGYVLVRIEPQETRDHALKRAITIAERNDAELGLKVARGMMPSQVALAKYKRKQAQLARVFGVPGEEPSTRVYRP